MKQLKRSECAILPLVLKGKWYDMIASGEKKEEYRDYKPYWKTRLMKYLNSRNQGNQKRGVIAFSRGYKKPDLFFLDDTLFYLRNDRILCRHPEWGEPNTPHYIIGLGERVELVD